MFTRPLLLVVMTLCASPLAAQTMQQQQNRELARPLYLQGWDFMQTEAWENAAKAFQAAIDKDPQFEDAYYGLGLADMRLRKVTEALAAYEKCRTLYEASAGQRFSSRQEAQRYRQDRLTELDEVIRQVNLAATNNPQSLTRLRQLQEQRRQLQEVLQRSSSMSIDKAVPAFVYLALGSAHFRLEQWDAAEKEYRAAVNADPKTGEAFNNLAVLYLQTGRFKEADEAVKSAEKAGFKVHPQLKQDIKTKLG
jgi:tetratricopeptide (TPR) repeat protein